MSSSVQTAGGERSTMVDLAVCGVLHWGPGQWRKGEVLVTDGRVVALTEKPGLIAARKRIDTGDSYVLPGAVDAHVHCFSDPAEGILAATSAAAAGGVTTIVEMPFDAPGPINSVERLRRKQKTAEREAVVDIALLGTLAPEGGWRETAALVEAGVCGFKVSLFDTDPARFPRIDDAELRNVMRAVADAGTVLCVHAENNEIIKAGIARESAAAKAGDPRAHGRARPPVSETLGVVTALELAHEAGASLHLCHLSLPRAVDIATWYRQGGTDVSVETCPHYLCFTEEDMVQQKGRLKINPPLRSQEDQDGLWERVAQGAIGVIASDHAPWAREFKIEPDIFANHSGVPGVETIVSVTWAAALKRGHEYFEAAVQALTATPADRFGLGHRKGRLLPGFDADIVVFDPTAQWSVDETQMHSNAGWNPYDGMALQGKVTSTISRGVVAFDGREVLATGGSGRLVAPGR